MKGCGTVCAQELERQRREKERQAEEKQQQQQRKAAEARERSEARRGLSQRDSQPGSTGTAAADDLASRRRKAADAAERRLGGTQNSDEVVSTHPTTHANNIAVSSVICTSKHTCKHHCCEQCDYLLLGDTPAVSTMQHEGIFVCVFIVHAVTAHWLCALPVAAELLMDDQGASHFDDPFTSFSLINSKGCNAGEF